MEPNVRFWIAEHQSFVRRFLQWTEILDPTNLVISIEKIEKSRQLLFTSDDASRPDSRDHRVQEAWKRSLSTVHPDSSKLIPVLFRPAGVLVRLHLSLQHHQRKRQLQSPSSGGPFPRDGSLCFFSLLRECMNRKYMKITCHRVTPHNQLIPYLAQMKYPLDNLLIKRALPIIFIAQVSGINVFASRSFEPVRGIEVMDKEGNVIGLSRRAGRKAVRETALSRAVLFGTSALIPEVFTYFFKRTQFFLKHPPSLWSMKLSCTILTMGLMAPLSFSMFPQVGRIQCAKLEEDIRSSTEETEVFYHRGV
uniref:Sideroflexin 4 n=1 Tax=Oryctolagus cuniculus TaxID=9986 RepID=A0A5F9D7L6_RABIT